MTDSVTRYPCPICRTPADLTSGCPGCGRPADPVASEVVRLNGELARLAGEVQRARETYLRLFASWRDTRLRRDELAARVRVAGHAAATAARVPGPLPVPVPVVVPAPAPAPAGASVPGRSALPTGAAPVRPETSTRTVQNLLFVLGGLLLGTAAIVFTAVAWATVGVVGRAAILAAVTGLALAAPVPAVRRGLTATAETFAAVGLLLVVLDGYAAWSVDLFGVAGWPVSRYAGLVALIGAAVAAGYGRLTGLRAPWFAGLALVQAAPPLLAYEIRPDTGGWALVSVGVAALDLAVVWRLSAGGAGTDGSLRAGVDNALLARRVVGWLAYGSALLVSTVFGLAALAVFFPAGRPVLAGGPLLVVVLLLAGGSVVAGGRGFQAAVGAVAMVVLALAVIRPIAALRPTLLLVGAAVTVALLVAAVVLAGRRLPSAARLGARIGGLVDVGWLGLLTVPMALAVVATTVAHSLPLWRADVTRPVGILDWQLPVAVVLVTVALGALLPRTARGETAAVGGALGVLALPAAADLPWWLVSTLDLVVAVGLLSAAIRPVGGAIRPVAPATGGPAAEAGLPTGPAGGRPVRPIVRAAAGAVLAGHAVLVSLARPASAVAVLAAVLLAGSAIAGQSRGATVAVARRIGGASLTVGLLAWPALVLVGLLAVGAPARWQARSALAAVVLLAVALVAVRRWWPGLRSYAEVALAMAAVLTGLSPALTRIGEPLGLYAALGLLVVSAARLPARAARPSAALSGAGWLLLSGAALAVLPAVGAVLLAPYAWIGAIWSGPPDGVGLTPGGWRLPGTAGAALLVLAAGVAVAGWARRRGPAAAAAGAGPVVAVAVLVLLAELGAGWPTVPAVALTGGLGTLLVAALRRPGVVASGAVVAGVGVRVGVPVGALLAGAGLAGALPARASTLAALASILAVASVVGAAGRYPAGRLAGWLVAALAGGALAVTATLAADLPLRRAGFAVLAVAVLALAVGATLRARRPVEATAVDACGQAAAVVALLLTLGDLRYAATVGTLWGVVVGIRALRPGEETRRRYALAAVAAGSELLGGWLLLTAERVALLEAYTLPAAGLALAAGWLALRARPALSSWLAYGPGLAAGLLPGLVSVLVVGDQPWRRLLLGVGALVTVLAGAGWRRQAPVLLGGAALTVLALRELAAGWDLLPRWIFLAAGGLILIGLAATYERRRRDLSRLRATLARMT